MSDDQAPKTGTFARLMKGGSVSNGSSNEPTDERSSSRSNKRTNTGTNGRTSQPADTAPTPVHRISLPKDRQRVRWAFDIFQDQKKALDTLQFARMELGEKKPTVAKMAQDALDAYIASEVKKLQNVKIDIED